jgi:hypothetical protein
MALTLGDAQGVRVRRDRAAAATIGAGLIIITHPTARTTIACVARVVRCDREGWILNRFLSTRVCAVSS